MNSPEHLETFCRDGVTDGYFLTEIEEKFSVTNLVYYEVAVGIAGLFVSGLFLSILNQNSDWHWRKIAYKFTAALTFFSISILSQVLSATWEVINLGGMGLPPLNVIFESVIIAFMVSGLWDMWTNQEE